MVDNKFSEMVAHAQHLQDIHGSRNDLLRKMNDMYFLRDAEADKLKKQFKNVVSTLSPDAANAVETAVRLMTANYPNYNVPKGQSLDGSESADTIEELCAAWMRASDRVRGTPVHVDGARSGLLYDEIHISVNSTEDLLRWAKGASPGVRARIERIAAATPYLFNVHDPAGCYADFDELGLRAWARTATMTAQQIREAWGKAGEQAIGGLSDKAARRDEHIVWTMWDLTDYCCWIDGAGTPILLEPHGLSFIPVVVHTVEGSRLFSDIAEQRRPFLYTLHKSGMWSRQNIALSALFTRVQTRLWATLAYEAPEDAPNPEIDTTQPLSIVRIAPGTKLSPLPSDPAMNELWQAWQLAEQKGTESTIYKQVAGQPVRAGSATYSETALLNQAGRLPLTGVQRKLGWALGDALRLAFLWHKENGGKAGIRAADIPDDLEIEVTLDPVQAYERMQLANIYNMLAGKLPEEYLMENLMGIQQPRRLIKQMWKERITNELVAQQIQQMAQPPAPQGPPPTQPGGAPVGLPPEMMQGGMGGPEEIDLSGLGPVEGLA